MSAKKKGSNPTMHKKRGEYDRMELDMQASIAENEYAAIKGTVRGATIHELGIVHAFVSERPHAVHINRMPMVLAQRNNCADLQYWRKGEKLDDSRPIVVIDRKARIAAIGWPHANHTMILERMACDRVLVHEHATSIVAEGIWGLCMVVAEVNSYDGWGQAPGMTVTSMFQTCHVVSERWETQQMDASAGARAA